MMRKFIQLFLVIAAATSLLGCREEIKINNGEIPDQYLDYAEDYMGAYYGRMEGVPGRIILTLIGNRVVADYFGTNGRDILNSTCGAEIRELEGVRLKQKGKNNFELKSARFAFNPNRCPEYFGRTVNLKFAKTKSGRPRIDVSIMIGATHTNQCHYVPGDLISGVPPWYNCPPEVQGVYVEGRFLKESGRIAK